MGLLYQKRRLKVNKIKRRIAGFKTMLQRLRMLLAFFMVVGICYFGIWVLKLPQWYIDSDKLAKADKSVLTIHGNLITPDYKIINMIRQTQLPYIQIFRLDTQELEKNIAQLQPVKKVHVRRYWFPARLSIAIDERTPVFLLVPNLESEANRALTSDGVLIDHDYLPFDSSFKTKKLLTYGVRDGYDEVWDKKSVEEIIKLTRAIETYSNQEVQYIDFRNRDDVYIMLKDYLIRFGKINDTALNRAKYIASILPEVQKMNQKIKYIDLRWDDSRYIRLEGAKEIKSQQQNLPAEEGLDVVKPKNNKNENDNTHVEEEKPKEPVAAAAEIIEQEVE